MRTAGTGERTAEIAIKFAGFADEAGEDIDTQVRATKELGWTHTELRKINGKTVTLASEAEFEEAWEKLQEAGIEVFGFGADLAARLDRLPSDPQRSIDEMNTAIPRMHKCGATLIRCMSYGKTAECTLNDTEWRNEVVSRLKTLAKMAEDNGLVLAHENCSGYGGMSPQHSVELFERVDSPAFTLILDTANMKSHPAGDSAYEWYQVMKGHITHYHIKDFTYDENGKARHAFPGEGSAELDKLMAELVRTGYDGYMTIEPHMMLDWKRDHDGAYDPQVAWDLFIEHGRKLMGLVERAGGKG